MTWTERRRGRSRLQRYRRHAERKARLDIATLRRRRALALRSGPRRRQLATHPRASLTVRVGRPRHCGLIRLRFSREITNTELRARRARVALQQSICQLLIIRTRRRLRERTISHGPGRWWRRRLARLWRKWVVRRGCRERQRARPLPQSESRRWWRAAGIRKRCRLSLSRCRYRVRRLFCRSLWGRRKIRKLQVWRKRPDTCIRISR